MPRLSSHPLPPEVLRCSALRYIYETTPPAPKAAPRPPPKSGAPPAISSASEAGTAALPRRVVGGRYELERAIDSGGTALIYLARDLATGDERAVKLLKDAAAKDPILRACFLSGARAAMGISHHNVVRVLSVVEPRDDHPFAVMELLRGESLDATLGRERRLPSERVVALARDAARGLAAAHRSGIVHLDVKPENLFLVTNAHGQSLKILDFDLAWVPGVEDPSERHGRLILRGTAKYMAPEQILGDPVDARTDVYALGVVLFRLLTGQVPFDLELGTTLLRHHVSSPIPPPSWLVDGLDSRLDAVVVRATKKNPANRYPSMAALLSDLDAVSLDLALSARAEPALADRYAPRSDRARAAARALESAA
jgi:eukaryotic-like serine/threonine-protein kinase